MRLAAVVTAIAVAACTRSDDAPAPAKSAARLPAPPPQWMRGVWTREWIERRGARTDLFDVHYLQTPSIFGDVRIPRSLPTFGGAKSFADLSDAQLLALAKQRGFTGHVTAIGDTITWEHEIDFQPLDGGGDVGRVERVGPGAMYEHALDSSYVESWKSIAPPDSSFLVLRVERAGRLERVLLVAGDHFFYARNRATDLPTAPSLDSLIAASRASRDQIIAFLDCELSAGRVRGASLPWAIDASTLPWRVGRHLTFADSIHVSPESGQLSVSLTRQAASTVPVNTMQSAQLRALFPPSR